jgi:uncharacterized membrane protein YeaQ/YmgE (transglycosylase-associated protein family)
MQFSTITWLIVGALVGFFAGGNLRQSVREMALSIILGMVGAMAAGWAFLHCMPATTPGLDLCAIGAAAIGGAVASKIYRTVAVG